MELKDFSSFIEVATALNLASVTFSNAKSRIESIFKELYGLDSKIKNLKNEFITIDDQTIDELELKSLSEDAQKNIKDWAKSEINKAKSEASDYQKELTKKITDIKNSGEHENSIANYWMTLYCLFLLFLIGLDNVNLTNSIIISISSIIFCEIAWVKGKNWNLLIPTLTFGLLILIFFILNINIPYKEDLINQDIEKKSVPYIALTSYCSFGILVIHITLKIIFAWGKYFFCVNKLKYKHKKFLKKFEQYINVDKDINLNCIDNNTFNPDTNTNYKKEQQHS